MSVLDQAAFTPLAPLKGRQPEAPEWFRNALAMQPERSSIAVAGAQIETLAWGERGRPGLLLIHGNSAHADWWSFIAPQLTDTHRVGALSLSGMGGSDWRDQYSIDRYVEEAIAAAQHTGLFEGSRPPIFAGHSFGCLPVAACASRIGERLLGAIVMDAPFYSPEQRARRDRQRGGPPRHSAKTRVYASQEEALSQFRFMPPQRLTHLFIGDHIARTALRACEPEPGQREGWTWRFDPMLWARYDAGRGVDELRDLRCPIAHIYGERSSLILPDVVAFQRSLLPPGSPFIALPGAGHHLMVDEPLALIGELRKLLRDWPTPAA